VGRHEIELQRGASLRVQVVFPPALRGCVGGDAALVNVFLSPGLRSSVLGEDQNVAFDLLPAGPTRIEVQAFGITHVESTDIAAGSEGSFEIHFAIPEGAGAVAVDPPEDGHGLFEMHGPVTHRMTDWYEGQTACLVGPAGSYDAMFFGNGTLASGTVEIEAGRLARWFPVLRPVEHDPADDEGPRAQRCTPETTFVPIGTRELLVSWSPPGPDRAWPGERVIAVEGAESDEPETMLLSTEGPPGTSAIVTVRSTDGNIRRIAMPRTFCETM
jgi:hypothetical protein